MKNEILAIIKQHDIDDRIKSPRIQFELKVIGFYVPEDKIRVAINSLREEGYPIGSDTNGYFYASCKKELDHTIAQMTSRISKMSCAIRGLEKCFCEAEMELFV